MSWINVIKSLFNHGKTLKVITKKGSSFNATEKQRFDKSYYLEIDDEEKKRISYKDLKKAKIIQVNNGEKPLANKKLYEEKEKKKKNGWFNW